MTLNGLNPELHIYLSADLTVEKPYDGKIFVIGIQNYRLYSQTPTIAQVMVDIRMEIQWKLVKSNLLPKLGGRMRMLHLVAVHVDIRTEFQPAY